MQDVAPAPAPQPQPSTVHPEPLEASPEELSDGTLTRIEGKKEFRIYCEDSGWLRGRNGGRGVLVTSGFCRVLSEAHDRVVEKRRKDPDYLNRLREMLKTWTR
jgi:hypothetical protein